MIEKIITNAVDFLLWLLTIVTLLAAVILTAVGSISLIVTAAWSSMIYLIGAFICLLLKITLSKLN